MYHLIVKSKVKDSFIALSLGDYKPAVALMSPQCHYKFVGSHALGGSRSNRNLIEQWFQRFLRVLPGFQFGTDKIIVQGWPWNTTITVKLSVAWKDKSGQTYANDALQMISLKWFKAVDILTIDNSQEFAKLLERVATEFGIREAIAEPIEG